MVKVDERKLLSAIDCIIRDVDKKYDECLVDHFLEYVQTYLGGEDQSVTNDADCWFKTAESILKRLKSYTDHKAFVMMNQARAYKTFYSILKDIELTNDILNKISPFLDSLWSTLDIVIVNENLSSVTVMLSILNQISKSKESFIWLINRTIDPPLKLIKEQQVYEIKDVLSFLKFYIKTCNNYHTRNKAESLLESLIIYSVENEEIPLDNESQVLLSNFQLTLEELFNKEALHIIPILHRLIEKQDETFVKSLIGKYKLSRLIFEKLIQCIDKPGVNLKDICKCLALVDSIAIETNNPDTVLALLQSQNMIENSIVYLTCFKNKSLALKRKLLFYLLYPQSIKCIGCDNQSLIEKVKLLQVDMSLQEKGINDRLITSSFVNLGQNLNCFQEEAEHLELIIEVVINYIKCQLNLSKNHKNIMECCSILMKLFQLPNVSQTILETSLEKVYAIIMTFKFETDESKSILMSLLRVVQCYRKYYPQLVKLLDLAFQFHEHDIQNEFIEVFIKSNLIKEVKQSLDDEEKLVKLLWTHIYENAKGTDNRDLLGNLYKLFIIVDLKFDEKILKKFNIIKHQSIALILGNVLLEEAACISTVEHIISFMIIENYLEFILETRDSFEQGREVLIILNKGFCATIRGESSEDIRVNALKLVELTVKKIVKYCSENKQEFLNLLRLGDIFQTLYELVESGVYSTPLYREALPIIDVIKSNLKNFGIKLSDMTTVPEKEANDVVREKEDNIANFYLNKSDYAKITQDLSILLGDKMENSSLIDDIINYELIYDGIIDCY